MKMRTATTKDGITNSFDRMKSEGPATRPALTYPKCPLSICRVGNKRTRQLRVFFGVGAGIRFESAQPQSLGTARLLVCGVDGNSGATACCGASLGPAHGSYLPAFSSSAEKLIAAIGLESRYDHSARHVERLQDLSCSSRYCPTRTRRASNRSGARRISVIEGRDALPALRFDAVGSMPIQ